MISQRLAWTVPQSLVAVFFAVIPVLWGGTGAWNCFWAALWPSAGGEEWGQWHRARQRSWVIRGHAKPERHCHHSAEHVGNEWMNMETFPWTESGRHGGKSENHFWFYFVELFLLNVIVLEITVAKRQWCELSSSPAKPSGEKPR